MTLSRPLLVTGRLIATLAFTFLGLLLVTFLIGRVVPIDPVLAVVGDRAPPDVYERARVALGLDRPLWEQFLIYLRDVLQGDFGTSVLTSRPVLEDIARVFPATLELATVATVLGVLLGVPMGVAAAVWQGRWPDHLVRIVALVGYLMGFAIVYFETRSTTSAALSWDWVVVRKTLLLAAIVWPVTFGFLYAAYRGISLLMRTWFR